jgi:hypothetical protein
MKKKAIDIYIVLVNLKEELLRSKPTGDDLLKEIRTMRFKVSPKGNIKNFNLQNPLLLELLWLVGKIDEFLHNNIEVLTKTEKEAIENFMTTMWQKLYMQSGSEAGFEQVLLDDNRQTDELVDLEIYREHGGIIN